jgi:hypothetical protein
VGRSLSGWRNERAAFDESRADTLSLRSIQQPNCRIFSVIIFNMKQVSLRDEKDQS